MIDGRQVELCDECGFDGREMGDPTQALTAVCSELGSLLARAEASERPQPEVFSAVEYVDHSVEVIEGILGLIAGVVGADSPAASDLESAAVAVESVVLAITRDQLTWMDDEAYGMPTSVDWMLQHLLHDLRHHVLDIRRGYARITLQTEPELYAARRERAL